MNNISIGVTEKYIYWTEDDIFYERFCDRDVSNGVYLDDKWRSILNRTRKKRVGERKIKNTRKLRVYNRRRVKLYAF